MEQPCTRRSAISSRSANERYRPDSGFADGRNIAGGMPPAFRNNLVPTACDIPAWTAASSLAMPAAIAAQNRRCSSRPATTGRPGENNGARPDRSERRLRLVIATPPSKCCDDHLSAANTPRSSSATAAAMQVCAPRWVRSATPMTTPCARASSPPSNASFSIAAGSRHRPRRAMRRFAFIEGFYNPRRRHSSIGYLSPIDYERRHHAPAVDPDAHQPAAVLAAVKDKPSGRPQEAAVLDRRCARRPHHRAGRDGRMACEPWSE